MSVIQYLENEIRPRVASEVVEIAESFATDRTAGQGHFSIPREVFCYVDHLGDLAFGDHSTNRTVRFLKEFFPARYGDYAELLVAMWRNGTVHEHKPVSYRCMLPGSKESVSVEWLSANHNRVRERDVHLLLYSIEGREDAVNLVMNTCQLAHDLLIAIDGLLYRLRNDVAFKSEADTRFANRQDIRDVDRMQAGASRKQAVKQEIIAAWNARGGLINDSGKIIQPHPKEKGR